jgi:hypothetical protein
MPLLGCVKLPGTGKSYTTKDNPSSDRKRNEEKRVQSLFLWDWIELSTYRESRTSEEMKMIA